MPTTTNSSTTTITSHQAFQEMNELLSNKKLIRNFSRHLSMGPTSRAYTIITNLFPLAALDVYSSYNLNDDIKDEDRQKYFSAHRGGSQGDYREGMTEKIANVVDCLVKFPRSKRAVITIPNNSTPCHESDDDAKCMREIHFYLDDDEEEEEEDVTSGGDGRRLTTRQQLNATVWMRAQAAEIFPKNIHFVGCLMERVARDINQANGNGGVTKNVIVGDLYYLATTLVSVRED